MHPEAMAAMDEILDRWQGTASVLDVGSLCVNGTLRPLVKRRGWDYVGLDIVAGPNVDLVSIDQYEYPLPDNAFDLVISANVAEHVFRVWEWIPELARLVRQGGMLAILTLTSWPYHPYPIDCWRFLPDSFRLLFDETGCLHSYDIECYTANDIRAVAWKI